ncbi:hypothetical protein D3C80_861110 [compost metagenome]
MNGSCGHYRGTVEGVSPFRPLTIGANIERQLPLVMGRVAWELIFIKYCLQLGGVFFRMGGAQHIQRRFPLSAFAVLSDPGRKTLVVVERFRQLVFQYFAHTRWKIKSTDHLLNVVTGNQVLQRMPNIRGGPMGG